MTRTSPTGPLDPEMLAHVLCREHTGTLVLAADSAMLGSRTARDPLARMNCAVPLLR